MCNRLKAYIFKVTKMNYFLLQNLAGFRCRTATLHRSHITCVHLNLHIWILDAVCALGSVCVFLPSAQIISQKVVTFFFPSTNQEVRILQASRASQLFTHTAILEEKNNPHNASEENQEPISTARRSLKKTRNGTYKYCSQNDSILQIFTFKMDTNTIYWWWKSTTNLLPM